MTSACDVAADGDVDLEAVAAGDARRRMDDDQVRDARAFRMQRLLQPERTAVTAMHGDAGVAAAGDADLETRIPVSRAGRRRRLIEAGVVHPAFIRHFGECVECTRSRRGSSRRRAA